MAPYLWSGRTAREIQSGCTSWCVLVCWQSIGGSGCGLQRGEQGGGGAGGGEHLVQPRECCRRQKGHSPPTHAGTATRLQQALHCCILWEVLPFLMRPWELSPGRATDGLIGSNHRLQDQRMLRLTQLAQPTDHTPLPLHYKPFPAPLTTSTITQIWELGKTLIDARCQ